MTRAFKTRYFSRWQDAAKLTDTALRKAVEEMTAGLIDADLGGGLVKKRVPLPGRGKSGGARTIVATNRAGRWFFLLGYGKNEQDNIGGKAVRVLQETAADWLAQDDARLEQAVKEGRLQEIDL